MVKFAANISMLFQEYDFLDRFQAASEAGFKAVECHFPYAFDKSEMADRLQQFDLTQVLINLSPGDWDAGERGIAILPERREEFRASLDTAIDYAKALKCTQVNCLAGLTPQNIDPKLLYKTLKDNLSYAADTCEQAGIRLLIEAINTKDMPGFFLNTTQRTIDIIQEIGSKNIYYQYDIYHMQIMEGDLAATLEHNLKHIAHIQIADNPGRHEPGSGEINYKFLFTYLNQIGYKGWIGCEYIPTKTTEDSLSWLTAFVDK